MKIDIISTHIEMLHFVVFNIKFNVKYSPFQVVQLTQLQKYSHFKFASLPQMLNGSNCHV